MALAQMGVFCALCIGCHQLDINGGITQAKSLFRLNVQKKSWRWLSAPATKREGVSTSSNHMPQLNVQGVTYPIDAILFDKDGTLLNFGDLWIGWFDQLITTVNRRLATFSSPPAPLAFAELYRRVGIYPDSRLWDPTGPLTIGSLDDIVTIVALSLFEGGLAWNDATEITHDALQSLDASLDWSRCVTPVAGLLGFVARARHAGVQLAVVTSDDHRNALRHLSLLSLSDHFSVVLGHDQVPRGKPFPDMALAACQQLGVTPERTLIIGDSNGDMAMGKAAGLRAGIGICAAPHLSGEHLTLAAHVIRDYDTLAFGTSPR